MNVKPLLVFALALLAQGCATLVGGGVRQSVSISSDPVGTRVVLRSSKGVEAASVTAPADLVLSRKTDYQIEISMPGYQTQTLPLTRGTNGWIFGNFIFGWIPGFAIDFITGSAYVLRPSRVQVSMARVSGANGDLQDIATVRFLDDEGKEIRVVRIPMQPSPR